MSQRWKHKTGEAHAGENSVTVRGLTNGERDQFVTLTARMKAGEFTPAELPGKVVKLAAIGLTDEDLAGMPLDLLSAALAKIMELSGMKSSKIEDADDAGDPEKKD